MVGTQSQMFFVELVVCKVAKVFNHLKIIF